MEQGIVGGTISQSWKTFTSNIGRTYVLMIVAALLGALVSAPVNMLIEDAGWIRFIAQQLIYVLATPLYLAIVYSLLLRARGEHETLGGSLTLAFDKAVPLILGALVVTALTWIGLLLFIVPGIIVGLGFSQTTLLIMDQDMDWQDAMRSSWRMMSGYKFWLFLIGLAMAAIILVSMLPFLLGLFLSLPLAAYVTPVFYDRLCRERASAEA